MFEEIYYSASKQMYIFRECVRDEFGRSIISSVLEPLISEISALVQVEEEFERVLAEIRILQEELRAIGN